TAVFPAVLSHRDVILRDETGSGKTLGILAALLSKKVPGLVEAAVNGSGSANNGKAKGDRERNSVKTKRYLSSIMVTPTPELAIQVFNWARELLHGIPSSDLPKHVQLAIPPPPPQLSSSPTQTSSSSQSLQQRISTPPPKLLIGTPRRLLELLESGEIDVSRLQSLHIDEIDHLINVPRKYETVKAKYNRQVHPTFTEVFVGKVMKFRRGVKEEDIGDDGEEGEEGKVRKLKTKKAPTSLSKVSQYGMDPRERRLQVIVSSATLNSPVRREIEKRRGWLDDPVLMDVKGSLVSPKNINHHCLIMDIHTKQTRDIRASKEEDEMRVAEELKKLKMSDGGGLEGDQEFETVIPSWEFKLRDPAVEDDDDCMIREVAGIVKREKVKRGLLFLNSNVSVNKVVRKLKDCGVNAGRVYDEVDFEQLVGKGVGEGGEDHDGIVGDTEIGDSKDVTITTKAQQGSKERRTSHDILVITEHTARGLDLPDATHVIMCSPPSSVASYLHMSGRVGRFGKDGTAIVLLGGERYERKMLDIYKLLNINPVPLKERLVGSRR
ncbi:hypothetical protein HDU76_005257, partial [Blyttiomyces sp. JEL0837]